MNASNASETENIPAVTPQIQKVLDYIKVNGQITEKEIGDLLGLKKTRTYTITKQMRDLGLIKAIGKGENKSYLSL